MAFNFLGCKMPVNKQTKSIRSLPLGDAQFIDHFPENLTS